MVNSATHTGWIESIRITREITLGFDGARRSPLIGVMERYTFTWVDPEGWECHAQWAPHVLVADILNISALLAKPEQPNCIYSCPLIEGIAHIQLDVHNGEITAHLHHRAIPAPVKIPITDTDLYATPPR